MARALLWASAAIGIALAAYGILTSGRSTGDDPEGAVAIVNGRAISSEAFARFAGAVAAERKQLTLDEDERRRLLDRMIDEELLLQRGVELELHRHEPGARRQIVAALIASVTADAELEEPDEEELRRFYDENRALFTRSDRYEVDVAFFPERDEPEALAYRRAQELARRARAGEDFDRLRDELAEPLLAPLPAGALRAETIREYLGPTVAGSLPRLAEGEIGDPVRGSAGTFVLRLVRRLPGQVAPFDEVRRQVRSEALRRRGDDALRAYLTSLRDASDVRIIDSELAGP